MSPDWGLVAARSVHLMAVLQVAGAFLALAWFARDAAFEARRRIRLLAWAGLSVGALSGLALLAAQAAIIGAGMVDVLLHTQFGHAMLARATLAFLLAGQLAHHRSAAHALPAAIAMTATLAWGGHAAAGAPLHLTADILHLLAAAAWLGSLLPLAAVLRWGGEAASLRTVRRFSTLGAVAVSAALASGIANAIFLVGWLPGLVGTPHGQWLLVKLAVLAGLLSFAAFNRFVLTPRGAAGLAPLARTTLAETGLAVLLLGAVGVMGTLPPGLHSQPRWPFPQRIASLWPLVLEPATPYSFARPATAYTAAALVEGKRLHAAHCAGCHEAPLKTTNPGDIYWWATQGHAEKVLPDGADGWSVYHAIHGQGPALSSEVGPAIAAPDFDFDTANGEQGALWEEGPGRITLLVFFDDSRASRQRLNQLALRRPAIEKYGARILAIDLQNPRQPAEGELAVAVEPEMVEAYRLLAPGPEGHTEMLLDRATNLRAVWRPDDVLDWRAAKLLSRQLEILAAEASPENAHRH